jgi:hypothetical protein
MKKKVLSGFLALSMITALSIPVFAGTVSIDGDGGPVPVTLTTEAPVFSVTVPTELPIDVAADGTHTYATNVVITNLSKGPVKVSNLEISGQNGWEIVAWDTDMAEQEVDTKAVAMNINGAKTTGTDAINFSEGVFQVMTGVDGDDNQAEITYSAKLPTQSSVLTDIEIAEVIFTVTWNK